jgi:arylsulfatase A-like enzyme
MSANLRRPFGGWLVRSLVSLIGCLAPIAPAQGADAPAAAPLRPHIVHIVADDLGWGDVGYHGAVTDLKTPNIDKLAASGVRLEQFYVQPLCTPTRAALLTGRYPFRYGLQSFVIPVSLDYGLPTDERTLPQVLKAAGYRTAIIGKWHLGHAERKYWPMERGFDSQYGFLGDQIDYFKHEVNGAPDWHRNEQPLREEGYATTLIGQEAVRLIEQHDPNTPLYLYLAFNAPHSPYMAPKEYLDRFASIADVHRRTYVAMISALDDEVGHVLDALDRKQLRDRTLVVFHSDNGGVVDPKTAGEQPIEKAIASNGPFREGKGTIYEGGTRVVAMASWPGRIAPGGTVDQPIHAVDLFPTFVALAGGSGGAGAGKPLDGSDVWATISRGEPSPRTEVVYNIEPAVGGVRQGNWKLVWHAQLPAKRELFDLAADPYEKKNLASENPAKLGELQKRVNDLADTMAPPLFIQSELAKVLGAPPAFPWAGGNAAATNPANQGGHAAAGGAAGQAAPATVDRTNSARGAAR